MSWRLATGEESYAIHEAAYDEESAQYFVPVGPDTQFRFDCQRTGDCCRARSASENTVHLESDVRRVVHFCRSEGRTVGGVVHGKVLHLDGLSETERLRSTWMRKDGTRSYREGRRPCQFLTAENLCGIYAARPLLCRLAPLGFVLDRSNQLVALSYVRELERRCPACFKTETLQTVEEWVKGVFTPALLREMETHQIIGGAI